MANRPSVSIEWGTGAIPAGPTYTLLQQQNGYAVGQQPTAQGDNGWQNGVYQWQQYFDTEIIALQALSPIVRAFPVTLWTGQTPAVAGSTALWSAVCWGGDNTQKFCAVGAGGTTGQCVMTSNDGSAWTSQTAAVAGSTALWSSITSLGGTLVAVGRGGTTGQCVMTSGDGVTWSAQTAAVAGSTAHWSSVCTNDAFSLLVAVGKGGTTGQCVMTSPDGVTWTARTAAVAGSTAQWSSVCWSQALGLYVAVGMGSSSTSQTIMTSPNGTTWTARTVASGLDGDANGWNSICWSSDLSLLCAVGIANPSGATTIMTSPDGITWTGRTPPASTSGMYSVAWSSELGLFCAVGQNGSRNAVMTSSDGITWTKRIAANTATWTAVGYSSALERFCSVAGDVSTSVMTSR